jgi:hypothetical protein
MKIYILTAAILLIIVIFSSSFYNKQINYYHRPYRSIGAAAAFGWGLTGAPFDQPFTCSACHGGGIFSPTISAELLDLSNVPVTSYTASTNYTLRISILPTIGSPLYGFQTTCVQTSSNNNLNNWGTLLPSYANVLIASGRNYVEHNTILSNGIIEIPWTAPAASYGSVSFYSIGNTVDATGSSAGDSPTSTNILTIGESVLPVTLTTFNGEETKSGNKLYWETAQEINNDFFLIERSGNGIDFKVIGKLKGNGTTSITHAYSFNDTYNGFGANFYRLAQTDFDGKVKYSAIIKIQNKSNVSLLKVSPNPVVNKIIVKSNFTLLGEKYIIINNQGTSVLSGIFISNEIDIQKLAKGNYFLKIEQKAGELITAQFVK